MKALGAGNLQLVDQQPVTATEIYGGYLAALVVGVLLALAFTWSKPLEALMMPLLVSLNMIPKVALGPLIIVWFKLRHRAEHADRVLDLRLPDPADDGARPARGRARPARPGAARLRGSRWQIFTKIQLPGALPYIFSGMKVAAILAVAGAIVGEFLGSDKGLGYLMLQVQVTLDTAAMFMAVLLITLHRRRCSTALMVLGLERAARRARRARSS